MRPLDLIDDKLLRAGETANELGALVTSFMRSQPVQIEGRVDAAGADTVRVTSIKETPTRIPILLGEVLQGLRSALDNLMWALVEARGGTPGRNTFFPIMENEDAYNRLDLERQLGPELAAVIGSLQPFKGGNDSLWQLHHLDIRGKHRALVPVPVAVHSSDLGIGAKLRKQFGEFQEWLVAEGIQKSPSPPPPAFPAPFFRVSDRQCPLKVGDVVFSALPNTGPSPDQVQMMFELVLHEPPIVAEGSINDLIPSMMKAVKTVRDSVRPHLS